MAKLNLSWLLSTLDGITSTASSAFSPLSPAISSLFLSELKTLPFYSAQSLEKDLNSLTALTFKQSTAASKLFSGRSVAFCALAQQVELEPVERVHPLPLRSLAPWVRDPPSGKLLE